ncbi:MAG TPA: hypothetical protein VIV60_03000, partial [Polyangiaceae bacterium]
LEPKKIQSDAVSTLSPSICHEVMALRPYADGLLFCARSESRLVPPADSGYLGVCWPVGNAPVAFGNPKPLRHTHPRRRRYK